MASAKSPTGAEGNSGRPHRLRRWFQRNRSDLRFLLIFGLCMVGYYLITLLPPVRDGFFPAYLRLNARVTAAVLQSFGESVNADGQAMISTEGTSIQLERGCDAVEPSALFVSAVLASPVPLLSRVLAAAGGTVLLMLLNLIRVGSLYLVRVYYPSAFETMHLDVWQALFIFLAIVLWALWASRMARRKRAGEHATA